MSTNKYKKFSFNVSNYAKKYKDLRKIKKVIHFHADHFEPFMSSGRIKTEEEVLSFSKKMMSCEHSKNISLHYIFPFGRSLVGEERSDNEYHGVDGDEFLFSVKKDMRNVKHLLSVIKTCEFDLQFHIHHERFTKNDFYKKRKVEKGNEKVFDFISKRSTYKMDSMRFEKSIHLYKEYFKKLGGIDIDKWTFVHGMWALNGSDPEICNISDEIVILQRNGCVADLSFPAGRGHCNPTLYDVPTIIRPLDKIRSYDSKESIIGPWDGNVVTDGFLIWASKNKATTYSLDYYGKKIESLIPPEKRVIKWLENSPVINNTLYIKTHAHSANREYIEREFPLTTDYAKKCFYILEESCQKNKIKVEYSNPTNLFIKE